ncbi:uncharacterized protein LOC144463656 [Epinephelus lanceolatus]
MEVPAQNMFVELSDDSDFESPVLQRRRVTQRYVPSTTQQDHCEKQQGVETSAPSDDGMDLHAQQRPNEATTNFTDFILIDAEEDDAIEEAIRRSLSEEPVQSFQDSRVSKRLHSKNEHFSYTERSVPHYWTDDVSHHSTGW